MDGVGRRKERRRANGRFSRFSVLKEANFAGEVKLAFELSEVEERGHSFVLFEEVGGVFKTSILFSFTFSCD